MANRPLSLVTLFFFAASAAASFSSNLNYRSPSLNHPDLGISVPKVIKRSDLKTSPVDPKELEFTHGIASGDPHADSVILWTRASPGKDNSNSNLTVSGNAPLYDHDNAEYVKVSTSPICVTYEVAEDQQMKTVVDKGRVWTSSDVDYTVKVTTGWICSKALAIQ